MGAVALTEQEMGKPVRKPAKQKTKLEVFASALEPKRILGNTGISLLSFISDRIGQDIKANMTYQELGEEIGLSSSTCKRLHENTPSTNGYDYNISRRTIDMVLVYYNYEMTLTEVKIGKKSRNKILGHYHYD